MEIYQYSRNSNLSLENFMNLSTFTKVGTYYCEDLNQIDQIKPYTNKIISKNEFNIENFDRQKHKDDFIYTRVKIIKVGFENFWNGYDKPFERQQINYLISLVDGVYESDLNECHVIYHTHFGNQPPNRKNVKYIFWTGEKYDFDKSKYDLALSYLPDSQNNICYPYFYFFYHTFQERFDRWFQKKSNQIPENFCAFIVSNPNCQVRNSFFQFVNQNYKKVNSYGKVFNNTGVLLDFFFTDERQLELFSKHKFVICFENKKTDNYYITEKLLIAKASGCIPIYYGSRKCIELFDQNSFLYLEDETHESFEKLLNKIKLLDNNNSLYLSIRNKDIFKSEIKEKINRGNIKNRIKDKINFLDINRSMLNNCPKFYYINLERSKDRKQKMESLFQQYDLKYERVEAVDGNHLKNWDSRLNKYEQGCTMSHLKAIERFYQSDEDVGIICEDDMSFEFLPFWKNSIENVIHNKPEDCDILMLSYIIWPQGVKHLTKLYNEFQPLIFNSTCAYLINKKGASKILNNHTYLQPNLEKYTKIRPVADVFIYDLVKTYVYKYSLLIYPDNNTSTIHKNENGDHFHNLSKKITKQLYFD
jgi:glycosyl transferase family 25